MALLEGQEPVGQLRLQSSCSRSNRKKNIHSFFYQAFSRMGWLPWLCWKARSRVASSGCEAADADRAASRHAASRVDSLGRRSGSWSSGLWRMVNPSASDPADDSAAHFQIDCKSTREAGASWNEATGGYGEARCRAALPEPHGSASAARPARPAPLAIQSEHPYRSRLGFFSPQILKRATRGLP